MRIEGKKPEIAEVDMTPMIDIVFQLIAFFMVVTNFANTKADERVKLPKDELARPPKATLERELLLNIGFNRDATGRRKSGALVFYGTGEEIPVLKMAPVLDREKRYYADLGVKSKDVTVTIRADAEVPTGLVQEIIKLSQEAGFEKFALKATQRLRQ